MKISKLTLFQRIKIWFVKLHLKISLAFLIFFYYYYYHSLNMEWAWNFTCCKTSTLSMLQPPIY